MIGGDLSPLNPGERVMYYREVCKSIGVNPLTKPFEYLHLNGRLVLYARKDCTDQLRSRHDVSITDLTAQAIGDLYVVTVRATDGAKRTDMATGAVNVKNLGGEALANAMMKAETKAKRRVTLSLCGLGMLDESELPDMPGAEPVAVDPLTGEITAPSPPQAPAPNGDAVISEPQAKRFYAIASGHKWSNDAIHDLLTKHRLNSAKEIKVAQYDDLCELLKKGPKGEGGVQGSLA